MATKAFDAKLEKFELDALAAKGEAIEKANRAEWELARQLGITEEGLLKRHPELKIAEDEAEKSANSALAKCAWVTGISGAAGAAIPLVLPKLGKGAGGKRWGWRAAAAAATGLFAAGAAGTASVFSFGKPVVKKVFETEQLENAALGADIAMAAANNGSLPPDIKGVARTVFAANIPQRDGSYSAQAANEAAQPCSPGIKL